MRRLFCVDSAGARARDFSHGCPIIKQLQVNGLNIIPPRAGEHVLKMHFI